MRPVPNGCEGKLPGFAFLPRSSASAGKTDSEANAVSGEVSEANVSRIGVDRASARAVNAEYHLPLRRNAQAANATACGVLALPKASPNLTGSPAFCAAPDEKSAQNPDISDSVNTP
jgi:hypothetical protein